VLDRSFEAAAPNRKWIADFTYVWTVQGWLYVAAIVGLFSQRRFATITKIIASVGQMTAM
jgi:transposase InsO family protein